ncbi:DUF397 domain-containing protein [Actinomadura sp. LD22]|uniref:DUF397 domain-containing protein n=1 Tax=Actinomadura physcomitrii TaxID=2650748 RepID=A0A6I4MI27_9ACTN|nr:DUF397 domain-containing protein [Actinomadura physcomitrii]MWA04560.1 DUF397 domain-containing protein [Actinomadura physcomitrii]
MSLPAWRKSSRSGTQQGACVEVSQLTSGVGVRDSKNPQLGHLTLAPGTFADLIARAKRNELDL